MARGKERIMNKVSEEEVKGDDTVGIEDRWVGKEGFEYCFAG